MSSSKYKRFLWKSSRPKPVISSLRKENAYLKKTLVELSRQHSKHYKLVERFISLQTVWMENYRQQMAKDEQLRKKAGDVMDVVSPEKRKTEEIEGELDSKSDERASDTIVKELQNHLKDALEKSKQWLEYDQQREAYVRAIMARMLWLEKQLNEANKAHSEQHNEDHSDERDQICQMQEHYERLLEKAKDELQVLREEVDITCQNLIMTENWCKEMEMQVKELKQQVQTEKLSRKSLPEDRHCPEEEEEQLRGETQDLQSKLHEERRRSTNFELQANVLQKYILNSHHADREKIADLEQQVKVTSRDLEDEKQNCSYLKKQMVKVLKMLQKTKDCVTKQSKRDQQDCEATHPPTQLPAGRLTSTPHSSLLNESFLECPGCQAEYPASRYRELMDHLEICLD